jgi:hypothetical protein
MFFVDDLDGKWTLSVTHEDGSTESCITVVGDDDWIYPDDFKKQIGQELPFVVNVFNGSEKVPEINVYALPDNWKQITGPGKKSVHDVMYEIENKGV